MPIRSIAKSAAMPPCPACGPVPSAATSRYCQYHLRELRARWLAWRDSSAPATERSRAVAA